MRRGWAVALTVLGATVGVVCGGVAGSAVASTTAGRAQVVDKLQALTPGAPVPEAVIAPLKTALERLKADDHKAVYAIVEPYVARPDFAGLPEETRRAAWYLLGLAALQTDHVAESHKALKTATGLAGATGWDWMFRAFAASADGDSDDAVYAFTQMLETDHEPLSAVSDDFIDHLRREAVDLPRGERRQMRLLDGLLDAEWKPKTQQYDWSDPWAEHAGRWLERGETELAERALARVDQPSTIAAVRVDRRFAALVRKDPARFDTAKAHTAHLAQARARVQAQPRSLAAVNSLAYDLLAVNRAAEASLLTTEALGRPADAYDDPGERQWTLDVHARAQRDLGRMEPAIATWREAAATTPHDRPNGSQMLNLAEALTQAGQPAEALAVVSRIPDDILAPFGRMVAADIRACAAAQTGDRTMVALALASLADDEGTAPLLRMNGQLCAGDADGAAATLIAALKDPETRLDALSQVQAYPAVSWMTPLQRAHDARLRALQARPDVRAAIAAVGRVERQPYPAQH